MAWCRRAGCGSGANLRPSTTWPIPHIVKQFHIIFSKVCYTVCFGTTKHKIKLYVDLNVGAKTFFLKFCTTTGFPFLWFYFLSIYFRWFHRNNSFLKGWCILIASRLIRNCSPNFTNSTKSYFCSFKYHSKGMASILSWLTIPITHLYVETYSNEWLGLKIGS